MFDLLLYSISLSIDVPLVVSCSIYSNWEVVVWDGALSGGGGVQNASWQLRLDVLRREQDQNDKGKLTSTNCGKKHSKHDLYS